jgi:hypothetical protein
VAEEPVVKGRLLFAAWVVLAAVACALHATQGDVGDALIASSLLAFAGVGALLIARRPDNAVGAILMALALTLTVSLLAEGIYANDAERNPTPTDLDRLLVWLDNWLFFVWLGLATIVLPLLFPHGRPPSRRWRAFVRVGIAVIFVSAASTAFGKPRIDWGDERSVDNPLALGGPAGRALELIADVGTPVFVLVVLGALGGVFVRLRRATGVERQQLKLFSFAISVLLIGVVLAGIGEMASSVVVGNTGWTMFLIGLMLGVPVAIGFAVMRHRLYDIDVVIRRTLVYGALTATLAGTYLALVLVSGLAVGDSDLAVAAATLAVAALFRPARSRIQAAVDRRFFRRRYDTARTLDAFGGRLREELDLAALSHELQAVVAHTMQPAHVSVWLRRTP